MTVSCSTLSDDRLLDLLLTEEDRLPRAAVDEFVARGDRMVEPLTRILQDEECWHDLDETFWQPIHATLILGAIGGERAIPGLMAALRFAADPDIDIDWICEALPSIFAAIGPPALRPLLDRQGAADPESFERRDIFACLAAVATLHADRRKEILDALRDVAGDLGEPEETRLSAASFLLDFARPADRDLLLALGRRAERSGPYPGFKEREVRDAYEGKGLGPEPVRDWLRFYEPGEIERRQERWRAEEEAPADDWDDPDEPVEEDLLAGLHDPSDPAANSTAKVGRNDPCPCGSGKKFKKCCEP